MLWVSLVLSASSSCSPSPFLSLSLSSLFLLLLLVILLVHVALHVLSFLHVVQVRVARGLRIPDADAVAAPVVGSAAASSYHGSVTMSIL